MPPAPPGAPFAPPIDPLFESVVIEKDLASTPVGPPLIFPLFVTVIAPPLLWIGPATVVEMVWLPMMALLKISWELVLSNCASEHVRFPIYSARRRVPLNPNALRKSSVGRSTQRRDVRHIFRYSALRRRCGSATPTDTDTAHNKSRMKRIGCDPGHNPKALRRCPTNSSGTPHGVVICLSNSRCCDRNNWECSERPPLGGAMAIRISRDRGPTAAIGDDRNTTARLGCCRQVHRPRGRPGL